MNGSPALRQNTSDCANKAWSSSATAQYLCSQTTWRAPHAIILMEGKGYGLLMPHARVVVRAVPRCVPDLRSLSTFGKRWAHLTSPCNRNFGNQKLLTPLGPRLAGNDSHCLEAAGRLIGSSTISSYNHTPWICRYQSLSPDLCGTNREANASI